MDTDYWACGMLNHTYRRMGDNDAALRAAKRTLQRTEAIIAKNPNNGSAMGFAIDSLVMLGEVERAKDLMNRGLLLDPHNVNMRYNMACTILLDLHDPEGALDMLEPLFETQVSESLLNWSKADGDMDTLRTHPRYIAMVAAAEARLAAQKN